MNLRVWGIVLFGLVECVLASVPKKDSFDNKDVVPLRRRQSTHSSENKAALTACQNKLISMQQELAAKDNIIWRLVCDNRDMWARCDYLQKACDQLAVECSFLRAVRGPSPEGLKKIWEQPECKTQVAWGVKKEEVSTASQDSASQDDVPAQSENSEAELESEIWDNIFDWDSSQRVE